MTQKRPARWKKRGCLGVLVAAVVLVFAMAGLKVWCDARYYDGYDPQLPLHAEVRTTEQRVEYRREACSFDGIPDVRVPALLALPHGDGPFPCLIFLHGIGQEKGFLDVIAPPFVAEGFAMTTFDQHTRGERRLPEDAGMLAQALALRRRGALTVIETRRLLDYLGTRNDIDGDRLYLLGASYGAMTGCTAAAFEPRIRAMVATYGGGDLELLLPSAQVTQALGKWTPLATQVAAWFLRPADPVRHVHRIAPRPILFQNGTRDSLIPVEAARALFDAAGDPKEMVWYDSDHVGLDEEHVQRVLGDTIAWLKALESNARAK